MNIPKPEVIKKPLNYIVYDRRHLNDIISCPICLEIYKHPRNLKCGHSYCTTCLHTISFNNEITCPLCRDITKFNENNLLINLPLNTTLVSIIDETENNEIKNNEKNNEIKDNSHLQLKRSKSVDSFIKYRRYNTNKKRVIFNNNIDSNIHNSIQHNNILNDITDDYITDCNRECCSFQ